MDLRFKHPCTCIVSGPTSAGKTTLVKKIIQNLSDIFVPVPTTVFYCYNEYQPSYIEMQSWPNLKLCEGLPELSELKTGHPTLLILDDMMQEMKKNDKLTTIFSRFSHHNNCSVLHIVQNVFYEGLRTARINCHYLLVMKNPSDQLQIQTLARQLFPRKQKFVLEAYFDATAKPFSYLLIDMHQLTPDHLRIRTNILPGQLQTVYLPKQ